MPAPGSIIDLPLFRAVLQLPDLQLACYDALQDLPAFVAAELEGLAHLPRYRPLRRHLALCPRCGEQYARLLEIVLAEEQGGLPPGKASRGPDLSFLEQGGDDGGK